MKITVVLVNEVPKMWCLFDLFAIKNTVSNFQSTTDFRSHIELEIQSIVNQVCWSIGIDFLDESRVLDVFDVTLECYPWRLFIIDLRIDSDTDEIKKCNNYVFVKFQNKSFLGCLMVFNCCWRCIGNYFSVFERDDPSGAVDDSLVMGRKNKSHVFFQIEFQHHVQ